MPHRPTQESTALIIRAVVVNTNFSYRASSRVRQMLETSYFYFVFKNNVPSMKLLGLASTITAALMLIRTITNAAFMLIITSSNKQKSKHKINVSLCRK